MAAGTLIADNIQSSTPKSASVDNILIPRCKAFVAFNGVTTTAILQSFNVASLTDNGTGDTTVTFTTAIGVTNYACALGVSADGAGDGRLTTLTKTASRASGSVGIYGNITSANTKVDLEFQTVAIFAP